MEELTMTTVNSSGSKSVTVNRFSYLCGGAQVDPETITTDEWMNLIFFARQRLEPRMTYLPFYTPGDRDGVTNLLRSKQVYFADAGCVELSLTTDFSIGKEVSKDTRLYCYSRLFTRVGGLLPTEDDWKGNQLQEDHLFIDKDGWVVLRRFLRRREEAPGSWLVSVERHVFARISNSKLGEYVEQNWAVAPLVIQSMLDSTNDAAASKRRMASELDRVGSEVFAILHRVRGF